MRAIDLGRKRAEESCTNAGEFKDVVVEERVLRRLARHAVNAGNRATNPQYGAGLLVLGMIGGISVDAGLFASLLDVFAELSGSERSFDQNAGIFNGFCRRTRFC